MRPEKEGDRENLAINVATNNHQYTQGFPVWQQLPAECGLYLAGIVSIYTILFIHFAKAIDESSYFPAGRDRRATRLRSRDEKEGGVGRYNGRRAIEQLTTSHWISVQHVPCPHPF